MIRVDVRRHTLRSGWLAWYPIPLMFTISVLILLAIVPLCLTRTPDPLIVGTGVDSLPAPVVARIEQQVTADRIERPMRLVDVRHRNDRTIYWLHGRVQTRQGPFRLVAQVIYYHETGKAIWIGP